MISLLLMLLAQPIVGDHPIETDLDRRPRLVLDGSALIRGATIHTAVGPAFQGDVLVRDGKIAAVGRVDAPSGIPVIEAAGMHLAPGVVDCHSHIAIDGGVNEATVSISADVTIADVVDPEDISIYRAAAGGVTTARLLHGSANAIGGRDAVIKTKWKRTADEIRFPGAPEGIKFALGENPKRSNGGGRGDRFPASRMGVEAVLLRAFERAQDYREEWAAYDAATARGEDRDPPRRDVRLEALAGVLAQKILVHSHCYRQDEILMLLEASQRFGFRIATLQHVLEGYKVAREMAALGVGGSTFADWWAYKVEAYDGIPQNAAMMDQAGVLSSLNSDSDEMMRRLYVEAAKSVRYAGMDRVRALGLVTLFPAQQLGIGDRVGSIEVGKDADLVLLTGDPLSSLSIVRWTMIDGRIEFERRDAFGLESDRPKVVALEEPVRGPAPTEGDVFAITGATLHPITSPDVEDGVLVVRGGRIAALGKGLAIPAGARVIDGKGKHVYPGLIQPGTNVGLLEIGAIASTDDQGESQGNQPDLRAAASVHSESAHIGVTRTNGITRVQTAPQRGGPMRGQSAVLRLSGDTWQEMLQIDRDMLHVAFPGRPNVRAKDAGDEPRKKEVETLARMFADAKEYGRVGDAAKRGECPAPAFDPRLDALVPYARGEKPVALHADNAQTILDALRFAKDNALKAVLFGANEGWKVVDALAREQVPVVVGPVLALPRDRLDPYDAAYANAAVLARAGVPFAIMTADEENARNQAGHAAMACAFGLPHEEALRAITYYPARILGIEKDLGSLAVGKIADVIVTDGDLLETTSRVESMWIDGKSVDLSNRQTELYERYLPRCAPGR
ncbi:MAG: amidohydrolase family protein [Planctomycetota bacterium]|nr:amidohydrolase family protein [Planctomycetota bacterium]